jgi:hypothetical protein
VIGGRTKTFFWLSVLPLFFVIGAASWVMIYSFYLAHAGQATYFVTFHLHRVPLLILFGSLFLCGLVSLFFDKQSSENE